MKLFKSLLVAPATLGLLAPMSVNATEVNLNEISRNDYISRGLERLNYFSIDRFNALINKCLYGS